VRVKGGQVDKGGLKVGGGSDILAVPVCLETEGALQQCRTAEVGHVLNQGAAGCGAREAVLLMPPSPDIRPSRGTTSTNQALDNSCRVPSQGHA
jgi:hypothetical protein